MPMLWSYDELTADTETFIDTAASDARRQVLEFHGTDGTVSEYVKKVEGAIDLWSRITFGQPQQIPDEARLYILASKLFQGVYQLVPR